MTSVHGIADAHRLYALGRVSEAETACRNALRAAPRDVAARNLLGILLHRRGDLNGAIKEFERALKHKPADSASLTNLGAVLRDAGRPADAVGVLRRALKFENDLPEALFNLGHALQDLGDGTAAIEMYRSLVRLRPGDAAAHAMLGDLHWREGDFSASIEAYERALTYEPTLIKAHQNIAAILLKKGWTHAALEVLTHAGAIAPQDAETQKRLGGLMLRTGNLHDGWPKFEGFRFDATTERVPLRETPPPYWRGEDLTGKKIVIWTEQGIGDEILHAGAIPEILSRADRCVIECSKRLAPVFARSFASAEVAAYESPQIPAVRFRDVDFQTPIGSLGRYLRLTFSDFPKHKGYLRADSQKVARCRETYERMAQGRRIVGVAWRSARSDLGPEKSARLRSYAPLLQMPDIFFVNVQYGDCREEIAEAEQHLGVRIFDDPHIDPLRDVDDQFSQVAALDLVISTSNSVVHVAGSQGIPTWVLLPFGQESHWYWFLRREDSPWYPSLRLLRAQKIEPAPWESKPIARAHALLSQWLAADLSALRSN